MEDPSLPPEVQRLITETLESMDHVEVLFRIGREGESDSSDDCRKDAGAMLVHRPESNLVTEDDATTREVIRRNLDRDAIARSDRRDFVPQVRGKRDEQPRLRVERKSELTPSRLVDQPVEPKSAAGIVVVQENDDRDPPHSQVIEIELFRVAVLVANEKVAFLITQKLRRLAVREAQVKMRLEG